MKVIPETRRAHYIRYLHILVVLIVKQLELTPNNLKVV